MRQEEEDGVRGKGEDGGGVAAPERRLSRKTRVRLGLIHSSGLGR
jgi:hypothetical protein